METECRTELANLNKINTRDQRRRTADLLYNARGVVNVTVFYCFAVSRVVHLLASSSLYTLPFCQLTWLALVIHDMLTRSLMN